MGGNFTASVSVTGGPAVLSNLQLEDVPRRLYLFPMGGNFTASVSVTGGPAVLQNLQSKDVPRRRRAGGCICSHGWQFHSLSVSHRWASCPLKPSIRGRSPEAVFRPHIWQFHSLSVSHRWASCPSKPSIEGRSPKAEAVFLPHGWRFCGLSVRHRLASFKTFKTSNQRTFPGGCISSPWVAISQPQCQSQVGQSFFKPSLGGQSLKLRLSSSP
jgi:hypothetical protein